MNPKGMRLFLAVFFIATFTIARSGNGETMEAERFAIHEWGTFTSVQDEEGNTLGGINTDDEPVPQFVHDISRSLLIHPSQNGVLAASKGVPLSHRDVTMRLETPVLYIHAPKTFDGKIGVAVAFRGGWLTQFFPKATVEAPGIDVKSGLFGRLSGDTNGSLEWSGITLSGEDKKGPPTTDRVWLAPRAVNARMLTVGGESERFLFYRGVGHLEAPLRVVRDDATQVLSIFPGRDAKDAALARTVQKLWLVEIQPNGTGAFRVIEPALPGRDNAPIATTPGSFVDFSSGAIDGLRAAMKAALVEDGLFDDEAESLLNTWQVSYFKSPGTRLFFMTPIEWTDRVLPLTVTGMPNGTETVRTMVGRIELVTPKQRQAIHKIATVPNPASSEAWSAVAKEYRSLGRFASAILFDELKRRPTPALKRFINNMPVKEYPEEGAAR